MATRTRIRAEKVARTIIVVAVIALAVVIVAIGYVTYSLIRTDLLSGGEVIVVPDVIGQTEQDAEETLKRAGLAPHRLKQRMHSNEQPAGLVFKQDPEAGAKVKQGRVRLWVSLGKASFVVPELSGLPLSQIIGALRDQGLYLGKLTKVYRPDLPVGQVVNQEPAAGREFTSAVPVDVVISDAANLPLVAMPEVTGQRLVLVEDLLARSNLRLARVNYVPDDGVTGGTVVAQDVPAGEQVQLGAPVTLSVALPSELMNSPFKRLRIHVTLPPGPEQQAVKIKYFDALGQNPPIEMVKGPGEQVDQQIDIEGRATIYIFINDMDTPYREEHL